MKRANGLLRHDIIKAKDNDIISIGQQVIQLITTRIFHSQASNSNSASKARQNQTKQSENVLSILKKKREFN